MFILLLKERGKTVLYIVKFKLDYPFSPFIIHVFLTFCEGSVLWIRFTSSTTINRSQMNNQFSKYNNVITCFFLVSTLHTQSYIFVYLRSFILIHHIYYVRSTYIYTTKIRPLGIRCDAFLEAYIHYHAHVFTYVQYLNL